MCLTTGLSRALITEVCAWIEHETAVAQHTWPPVLGLFDSVVMALTYLRRNRAQAEVAEHYNVSQATISRAITRVTPLLDEVLAEAVPTADDLDGDTQYVVDGSLLPY